MFSTIMSLWTSFHFLKSSTNFTYGANWNPSRYQVNSLAVKIRALKQRNGLNYEVFLGSAMLN
jgi:hypothetical protein